MHTKGSKTQQHPSGQFSCPPSHGSYQRFQWVLSKFVFPAGFYKDHGGDGDDNMEFTTWGEGSPDTFFCLEKLKKPSSRIKQYLVSTLGSHAQTIKIPLGLSDHRPHSQSLGRLATPPRKILLHRSGPPSPRFLWAGSVGIFNVTMFVLL